MNPRVISIRLLDAIMCKQISFEEMMNTETCWLRDGKKVIEGFVRSELVYLIDKIIKAVYCLVFFLLSNNCGLVFKLK